MFHTARWLVTVWLIAGCAGGRGELRGSAGDEAALTVGLRVDASAADGNQRRVLKPSEPLHAGDKIALDIDVDRPLLAGAYRRPNEYTRGGRRFAAPTTAAAAAAAADGHPDPRSARRQLQHACAQ